MVVFVSGAVLMGLEMTGSRILAIHFGSSIYVWGAIIGVFLAALSIGYYSGGMLADLRPSFYPLNASLLIAGGWLLLIPFYANPGWPHGHGSDRGHIRHKRHPLCLFFVRRAQCGYVSHTESAARPSALFGAVIIRVPAGCERRFNAEKARADA